MFVCLFIYLLNNFVLHDLSKTSATTSETSPEFFSSVAYEFKQLSIKMKRKKTWPKPTYENL